MNKKSLGGLLLVTLLGIGGYAAAHFMLRDAQDQTSEGGTPADGPPRVRFFKNPASLPELTLSTLDGRTLTSKDLAGKVTLVNFWATWCPPCRAEIPDLVKLQEQYKDQLTVIGVSSDEGPTEMVSRFAADYKINYPIVMETDELSAAFPGVFALPTSFLVGPDLKVMSKHVGQIRPAQIELETRVLSKLPTDAAVEYTDGGPATLTANSHATDVPGLNLAALTPDQRTAALKRLNEEPCGCGCGMSIAACRINDSTCAISPPLAQKVVDEVKASMPAQP